MKIKNTCIIQDLGLIDYGEAYCLQKQYLQEIIKGGDQVLLLCEHPTTLTLGRLADSQNILIQERILEEKGVKVYPIDRGGDVTVHAPGQLIAYPIFDLSYYGKDLRLYLSKLEQVAIDLLKGFDIVSYRFSGRTGVWVNDEKIASIGIGVKKWISFHGLAINVNTDLEVFSLIRPCGLDVQITSIAEIKRHPINMTEAKRLLIDSFNKNFSMNNNISTEGVRVDSA